MNEHAKNAPDELKPSLRGHKAPARRTEGDASKGADAGQAGAAPEVGRDVDCELPDSDLVRDETPRDARSGRTDTSP